MEKLHQLLGTTKKKHTINFDCDAFKNDYLKDDFLVDVIWVECFFRNDRT